MTPQQRLDYQLAPAGVVNSRPITGGEITAAVGIDDARIVIGTIQAVAAQDPLVAISLQALATVGMRLDSAERQAMIDALAVAGQWSDDLRDKIKNLGIDNRPRWVVEGREAEPTLAEMQADADADRLINANALFSERMTADGDAAAVWAQAWADAEAV